MSPLVSALGAAGDPAVLTPTNGAPPADLPDHAKGRSSVAGQEQQLIVWLPPRCQNVVTILSDRLAKR